MKITENDFKSALPELAAAVEVCRDRCRIGDHQIADFSSYYAPAFESILLRL